MDKNLTIQTLVPRHLDPAVDSNTTTDLPVSDEVKRVVAAVVLRTMEDRSRQG